jgi:Ribulose-5-phosphate 4-epimerase and related epimerases and aldolases
MVAEFGGNDIKCAEYATFGTRKLANNVLKVIRDRNGCLISNHGQLTIANNLNNALNLAVSLEKISKQYFFCNFLKGTTILSSEEMIKVLELFKNYKVKH